MKAWYWAKQKHLRRFPEENFSAMPRLSDGLLAGQQLVNTTLPAVTGTVSVSAATAAFDEGLTPADVSAIVAPFIIP